MSLFPLPVCVDVATGVMGRSPAGATDHPVGFVQELKEAGSGDVVVAGGVETVRSLFVAGALDVLTPDDPPVARAQGRRLFESPYR